METNILTSGDSASTAISTDFGGATVNVTGGNVVTAGIRSPAVYSTGVITVTGVAMSSNEGSGGVIDGANTINLLDSVLVARTHGLRSFRSAPGSG